MMYNMYRAVYQVSYIIVTAKAEHTGDEPLCEQRCLSDSSHPLIGYVFFRLISTSQRKLT
jgi:hypothetical protein